MIPYNNSNAGIEHISRLANKNLKTTKNEKDYNIYIENLLEKKNSNSVSKFIEYLKTNTNNKNEQLNIKSSKTIDDYIDKTINAILSHARLHDREDEHINFLFHERAKILKAYEAERRKLESSQLTMQG